MRWRTASEECDSAPRRPAMAAVKKYFISKVPRLVPIALLEVTRDTVDSCMPIASATVFRLSGRKMRDALAEEAVLLADDLGRDLQDRLGALVEARASQLALCRQSVRKALVVVLAHRLRHARHNRSG